MEQKVSVRRSARRTLRHETKSEEDQSAESRTSELDHSFVTPTEGSTDGHAESSERQEMNEAKEPAEAIEMESEEEEGSLEFCSTHQKEASIYCEQPFCQNVIFLLEEQELDESETPRHEDVESVLSSIETVCKNVREFKAKLAVVKKKVLSSNADCISHIRSKKEAANLSEGSEGAQKFDVLIKKTKDEIKNAENAIKKDVKDVDRNLALLECIQKSATNPTSTGQTLVDCLDLVKDAVNHFKEVNFPEKKYLILEYKEGPFDFSSDQQRVLFSCDKGESTGHVRIREISSGIQLVTKKRVQSPLDLNANSPLNFDANVAEANDLLTPNSDTATCPDIAEVQSHHLQGGDAHQTNIDTTLLPSSASASKVGSSDSGDSKEISDQEGRRSPEFLDQALILSAIEYVSKQKSKTNDSRDKPEREGREAINSSASSVKVRGDSEVSPVQSIPSASDNSEVPENSVDKVPENSVEPSTEKASNPDDNRTSKEQTDKLKTARARASREGKRSVHLGGDEDISGTKEIDEVDEEGRTKSSETECGVTSQNAEASTCEVDGPIEGENASNDAADEKHFSGAQHDGHGPNTETEKTSRADAEKEAMSQPSDAQTGTNDSAQKTRSAAKQRSASDTETENDHSRSTRSRTKLKVSEPLISVDVRAPCSQSSNKNAGKAAKRKKYVKSPIVLIERLSSGETGRWLSPKKPVENNCKLSPENSPSKDATDTSAPETEQRRTSILTNPRAKKATECDSDCQNNVAETSEPPSATEKVPTIAVEKLTLVDETKEMNDVVGIQDNAVLTPQKDKEQAQPNESTMEKKSRRIPAQGRAGAESVSEVEDDDQAEPLTDTAQDETDLSEPAGERRAGENQKKSSKKKRVSERESRGQNVQDHQNSEQKMGNADGASSTDTVSGTSSFFYTDGAVAPRTGRKQQPEDSSEHEDAQGESHVDELQSEHKSKKANKHGEVKDTADKMLKSRSRQQQGAQKQVTDAAPSNRKKSSEAKPSSSPAMEEKSAATCETSGVKKNKKTPRKRQHSQRNSHVEDKTTQKAMEETTGKDAQVSDERKRKKCSKKLQSDSDTNESEDQQSKTSGSSRMSAADDISTDDKKSKKQKQKSDKKQKHSRAKEAEDSKSEEDGSESVLEKVATPTDTSEDVQFSNDEYRKRHNVDENTEDVFIAEETAPDVRTEQGIEETADSSDEKAAKDKKQGDENIVEADNPQTSQQVTNEHKEAGAENRLNRIDDDAASKTETVAAEEKAEALEAEESSQATDHSGTQDSEVIQARAESEPVGRAECTVVESAEEPVQIDNDSDDVRSDTEDEVSSGTAPGEDFGADEPAPLRVKQEKGSSEQEGETTSAVPIQCPGTFTGEYHCVSVHARVWYEFVRQKEQNLGL